MSLPIYLDYAASTPVDPEVARIIGDCLTSGRDFGNSASATHEFGHRASLRIEAARRQVAALIRIAPEDIVFTSGATESNNLAILGVARANVDRGRHIITSRIEHKAVLDPCRRLEKEGFRVTYLSPDCSGQIRSEALQAAIRPDTVLVSLMMANNETGVLQDVAAIGRVCQARGVTFHSDAAQAVGKMPVDLGDLPIDLLSFTAHKLYGPQGVGVLYVRPGARSGLQAVSFGGGQERGLRPGTLPTHQIVGLGAACELAERLWEAESLRVAALRDRLWKHLESLGGVFLNGLEAPRLPSILNVSFQGVEGESLVTGLSDLAVSTGSACNSASGEPSYVLRALGRDSQLAQASLRFSLGRFTTVQEIDTAGRAVRREVLRLRAVSPQEWPVLAQSPDTPDNVPETGLPDRAGIGGLSEAARQYFVSLPGAGTLTSGCVIQGEAGSRAEGTWVRFHLSIEQNTVKNARFQALGCPHTLATTAWLTDRLAGRDRQDLVPDSPSAWMEALGVPIEKLGRLLVIEDALRACARTLP